MCRLKGKSGEKVTKATKMLTDRIEQFQKKMDKPESPRVKLNKSKSPSPRTSTESLEDEIPLAATVPRMQLESVISSLSPPVSDSQNSDTSDADSESSSIASLGLDTLKIRPSQNRRRSISSSSSSSSSIDEAVTRRIVKVHRPGSTLSSSVSSGTAHNSLSPPGTSFGTSMYHLQTPYEDEELMHQVQIHQPNMAVPAQAPHSTRSRNASRRKTLLTFVEDNSTRCDSVQFFQGQVVRGAIKDLPNRPLEETPRELTAYESALQVLPAARLEQVSLPVHEQKTRSRNSRATLNAMLQATGAVETQRRVPYSSNALASMQARAAKKLQDNREQFRKQAPGRKK